MVWQGARTATGYIVAAVAVLALLYFAQTIFVPLVFSLFIIGLVSPVQLWLQRVMPQLLALLLTLVATILVITAVGSSVAWGFGRLGQWLFVNARRFQDVYVNWTDWLEGHGIAIAGPLADRFDVA